MNKWYTYCSYSAMFLKLNHKKLDVYHFSREFVAECYRVLLCFPPEEKYAMVSQIRRAALSVHLNISEGASRKSETERKWFYEIARGSLVEIDAAFDIAKDLKYLENIEINKLGDLVVAIFKILSAMIGNARH
ncbi:four helix bundle protein [Chitinophagaceae bacterium MMS25-I14]